MASWQENGKKRKDLEEARRELLRTVFHDHLIWSILTTITFLYALAKFAMLPILVLKYLWHVRIGAWILATIPPLLTFMRSTWLIRHEIWNYFAAVASNRGIFINEPRSFEAHFENKKIGLTLKGLDVQDPEAPMVNIESIDITGGLGQNNDLEILITIENLDLHFITYDPRFHDTNLSRLLKRSAKKDPPSNPNATTTTNQGESILDQTETVPPPQVESTKRKEEKRNQYFKIIVLLKNAVIHVEAGGPLGIKSIIPPIKLDNETIDPAILTSKLSTFAWIQGLALRAVASSSLDAVVAGFGAAGHQVENATDLILGTIDTFASKIPGGSVISGVTGGAKHILAGTLDGTTAILGGVAGASKDVVRGLTSGSPTGFAQGLRDGGVTLGTGVKDAGLAVGTGVADATVSVGSGFYGIYDSIFPSSSSTNKPEVIKEEGIEYGDDLVNNNAAREEIARQPRRTSILEKLFCAGPDDTFGAGDQEKPRQVLTSERDL